jgi:hypothetical protein
MQPCRLLVEPVDVRARVRELCLDLEIIETALVRGQLGRDMCTAHHPACYPGMRAWAETNAALRDQLVLRGWTSTDRFNTPKTVSPSGEWEVTAITGDAATGDPMFTPSTRYNRGPASIRDVIDNLQWDFFDPAPGRARRLETPPLTWMLLYHRVRDTLAAELSLPTRVSEEGRIDHWVERILLPRLDMSDGTRVRRLTLVEDAIDVPVRRLGS